MSFVIPKTYRELQQALAELSEEQLDMSVSVYDTQDECHNVDDFVFSADLDIDDIVGENQPVLVLSRD